MSLRIRNWEKWQTYRKDRNPPPWIKVHREVMRNPEFVQLNDAQRGQLLMLWLLAADRGGNLPDDALVIRKLCFMDEKPDLQLFERLGFVERDGNMTSTWRQHDAPDIEAEEKRVEADIEKDGASPDVENSAQEPPAYSERPEYVMGELLDAANTVLGLKLLKPSDLKANQSILRDWRYSRGIPAEEVWAAIHGLRMMVDQGRSEVEWLKAGQPISLRALNNTHTLFDQGDGKAKRVLFDVAVEAYQRDDSPTNGKRGGGPRTTADIIALASRSA